MGKGDLWDDSALIKAFDDAITKCKEIDNCKDTNGLVEPRETTVNSTEENLLACVDESLEFGRLIEADDRSNVAANVGSEVAKADKVSQTKENCMTGACGISSNTERGQDVVQSYPSTHDYETYNYLLNKYYEVEEQRQKLMHQLQQQFGNWDVQATGSNLQWCTSSNSQALQDSANQGYSTVFCPYGCQCIVTPCPSTTGCSNGGTHVSKFNFKSEKDAHRKSICAVDGDFVSTAMGAAEQALSSLKAKACCNSDATVNPAGEQKELKTELADQSGQGTCSETDLAVVLNAWYSAGFYTGKYLSEQALAKK